MKNVKGKKITTISLTILIGFIFHSRMGNTSSRVCDEMNEGGWF
jgi:hypothetical protein